MKVFLKEGDIVFHRDNLDNPMTVSAILKESKEFIVGFNKQLNIPIKKLGTKMIGVRCNWFENDEKGNKRFMQFSFHTNELIPKLIVLKGADACKEYFNTQPKKKTCAK